MNTKTAPKKTSAELASEMVQSLQQDLATSSAVASLLILPMIRKAAELEASIKGLQFAIADDAKKGHAS